MEIEVRVKTIEEREIEERARNYCPDSIWSDMVWQIRDGQIVDYKRRAYISGAKKQKEIDNEELLKLKSELEEKEVQISQQYNQGYNDAIDKICELIDSTQAIYLL